MRKPLLDLALLYDLDLCIGPYSVQVVWYDTVKSETHSFEENVNLRSERKDALRRCVERAIAFADKGA